MCVARHCCVGVAYPRPSMASYLLLLQKLQGKSLYIHSSARVPVSPQSHRTVCYQPGLFASVRGEHGNAV